MLTREKTKKIKIGNIYIGGGNNIAVQSMCDIKTSNVHDVIKQINNCASLGADLMRVSILDEEDAFALAKIKKSISIPLVADIHNDYRLGILAIENGADKIRINPGNIGSDENLNKIIEKAKERNIPIRIGVNLGSLEKDLEDKNVPLEEKLVESALRYIAKFESLNFDKLILSVKASDPLITLNAYRLLAAKTKYPLHIGVTESGYDELGIVKSVSVLSPLLLEGIGNTIRISLTQNPEKEIQTCMNLLHAIGLKPDYPTLISCPTCGRTQVHDLASIAKTVYNYLLEKKKNITVAIMGCVINGVGEGKRADIGIAGGKNEFAIFKKGKIIKKVSEKEVIPELFALIDQFK